MGGTGLRAGWPRGKGGGGPGSRRRLPRPLGSPAPLLQSSGGRLGEGDDPRWSRGRTRGRHKALPSPASSSSANSASRAGKVSPAPVRGARVAPLSETCGEGLREVRGGGSGDPTPWACTPSARRPPQRAHAGRGSAGFGAQGASPRTLLPSGGDLGGLAIGRLWGRGDAWGRGHQGVGAPGLGQGGLSQRESSRGLCAEGRGTPRLQARGLGVRARTADGRRDVNGVGPAGTQTACQVRPAPRNLERGSQARGRPGLCARPVVGADARARDFLPSPTPPGERPAGGRRGCRRD